MTIAGLVDNARALEVSVGVIFNRAGQVLISQRPLHVPLGGLWEFPGGKCEPGESSRQALYRELREEIGIEVKKAKLLLEQQHDYVTYAVYLRVYQVAEFLGDPSPQEGQLIRWVDVNALSDYSFPPANASIIEALRQTAF